MLMQGQFEISIIGELNYFLRLEIKQLNKGTFVCPPKYCHELLNKFDMNDAKTIGTLIPTNGNLNKDENGKGEDFKKYRGMIVSLLYLTPSRPDIMFSECICA